MRAITFVQAFQYWLKLTALAVPVIFLVLHWQGDDRPPLSPPDGPTFAHATTVVVERAGRPSTLPDGATMTVETGADARPSPRARRCRWPPMWTTAGDWLAAVATGRPGTLRTYSLILATFLGTMGLPHVLVRFYTNPDGSRPGAPHWSCSAWSACSTCSPRSTACWAGSTRRSC